MFGWINPGNDLSIYNNFAEEWWRPGAPRFRSLQNITPFRLELIRAGCGEVRDRTVYDLGCGGGLIAVPLLDAGADVVGVDLSGESIKAARRAARGRGRFFVGDARSVPLPDGSADIVLLADVIDHISDYPRAIDEASRLLKPGGRLFVGTLNRTFRSLIGAIILGEGLRLIPPGTHRHSLFVTPEELMSVADARGLRFVESFGEEVCVRETIRRWAITLKRGKSLALAFSMVFSRGEKCAR